MPFFPPDKRKPTPTHLYVMACLDAVKIGIAVNVEQRRRAIQMCCPYEVTILASVLLENFTEARAAEKQMHAMFGGMRTYGEWFQMKPNEAVNMLHTFAAYVPPPVPVPVRRPTDYSEDDEQMTRMRVAAKSLEF